MAGVPDDIEETVVAVQSVMDTYLGASLDAVDTSKGDSITLDDMADIFTAPQSQYRTLPAMVINGVRVQYARRGSERIGLHTIQIRTIFGGRDGVTGFNATEVLVKKAQRTQLAISNTIETYDTLTVDSTRNADGLNGDIEIEFEDVFEGEGDEAGRFRTDAVFTVQYIVSQD